MKSLTRMMLFLLILTLFACAEGEEDLDAPKSMPSASAPNPTPSTSVQNPVPVATPVSTPAALVISTETKIPDRPKLPNREILSRLSYDESFKQDLAFMQKDNQLIYENENLVTIPVLIPNEIKLAFKNRPEWKALPFKAYIKQENNTRELQVSSSQTEPQAEHPEIKLSGLKQIIPSQPGILTMIVIEIGNDQKQTIQLKLGTPPAVPSNSWKLVDQKQRTTIWISPTLKVIPLLHYQITNENSSKWEISAPYTPPVSLIQGIVDVKYVQATSCSVKSYTLIKEETLTTQFLLARSTVSVTELSKLIQSQLITPDLFTLNPQESTEFTLYAVIPETAENPVLTGRKHTYPSQRFTPGCRDGKCQVQNVTLTRFAFLGRCNSDERQGNSQFLCEKDLTVLCSTTGSCDFGNHSFLSLDYGACRKYHQIPNPQIDHANYLKVKESRLIFHKSNSGIYIYHQGTPRSGPQQGTAIPWDAKDLVVEKIN